MVFIDEAYRPLLVNKLRRFKVEKTPSHQEGVVVRCTKKSGKSLYLTVKFLAMKDQKSNTNAMLVFSEISEQSLTLNALKVSEEKYRGLFENSSDAISIVDLESTVIEDVNNTASIMFGYEREELIGKKLADVLAESEYQGISAYRERIRAESAQDTLPARRFIKKDGSEFIGEISRRIFFSDGKEKLLSSIRDISTRLRLEERLRHSQKMEAIGSLAGGIAHDFNNILSSVLGFTELSLDEVEDGSVIKDNLEEVMIAGNRAKYLVQQILTFSHKEDPEVTVIKLKPIVEEALKMIRASLPSSILIQSELHSDSSILADPTQIHQVVMSLCINSGHAMDSAEGTLRVTLEDRYLDETILPEKSPLSAGNYVEITVEDTGGGIKDEHMSQLFDPFFTTKPEGEGTGMGLSVIKGIVKTLKGTILVDTKAEKGTSFKVYFPIMGNLAEEFKVNPTYESTRGTERILFVDDEEALVQLWVQVLGNMGYDITASNCCLDALKLLKDHPNDYDLIITDYAMPNMTGGRMIREILKIRPDIPIILCTGYHHKIDESQAKQFGISAYINKPILRAEILNVVRHVLDKKKQVH